LLALTAGNVLTRRHLLESVAIFGGTGSGKTSGSGKTIAETLLRDGWGGCVACVKSDEPDFWIDLAAKNGRLNDVVIFDQTQGFNFLNYTLSRQGAGGIGGCVQSLVKLIDALGSKPQSYGGDGNPFFDKAMKQLLSNVVVALYSACGFVSIPHIIRFIETLPVNAGQNQPGTQAHADFLAASFMAQTMRRMFENPAKPLSQIERDRVALFFSDFWAVRIPEETRGNIAITVAATLDRFQQGRLREMFCGQTTIVPEMCMTGAIIILAMPILLWHEDGIAAQRLFKREWQNAMLMRNALDGRFRRRPCFFWADESQYLVDEDDTLFTSTSRSHRAAMLYLTQSISALYARMGGEKSVSAVNALMGNFRTKIFHSNTDVATNEWAANLIGKEMQWRKNESFTQGNTANAGQGASHSGKENDPRRPPGFQISHNGGFGKSEGFSEGYSEQLDYIVQPSAFSYKLRTGGPRNNFLVDAYMHRAEPFNHGRNQLPMVFKQ
jgi:hypothetical protein